MDPLMNFLLLTVLFVAGLLNFLFYFPNKRITAWFQSIKPSPPPPSHFKSAAAIAVVPRPSDAEKKKAELRKVFGTFDKNNDGFITKAELMESLRNIRMLITEKDAEEMLKGVDENGDGLIDFEEFCVLEERFEVGYEEKRKGVDENGNGEDELREAFGIFDKDKDGLITVEELSLVLSSLGLNEGIKVENCEEMIKKVDLDGDGMVNFDEFKRMMANGGALVLTQS